ncbi:hypothetical protein MalM25_06260 [Planctomycetes bacterium MalM25]|nr:hypothetical protein MalM25_06260 [Planctomycetes bacterium MalM25]
MSDEEKKILIDEDWKSQVEAEKQAAAEQSAGESPASDGEPPTSVGGVGDSEAAAGSPDDPPMPEASIGMLMSSLATEALISMGQFPHPATGEVIRRPNQAKYLIDTLAMLKEKTEGNLSAEETAALDDVLHQLRMAFVAGK